MSDYPSEEILEKIKNAPCSGVEEFHALMELVRENWSYDAWERDGDVYKISTYGWSGNEDLIAALMGNYIFWSLYWEQSKRGGHYVFAPCCISGSLE